MAKRESAQRKQSSGATKRKPAETLPKPAETTPKSDKPSREPTMSVIEEVEARYQTLNRQRLAAEKVLNRHAKNLWARKGVVGFDVGLKITNHEYVRPVRYVIRIHVEAKLDESELNPRARFKPIDGIEIDVLERRYTQGAGGGCGGQPETRCFRNPMSGGVAISGDAGATFGTLGMRVLKDGKSMYLTNAHVLPTANAAVWQPPAEGPNVPFGNGRKMGEWSAHRKLSRSVDCALIMPTGGRNFQDFFLGLPTTARFKIGRLEKKHKNRTAAFKIGAKTGSSPQFIGLVESVDLPIRLPSGHTFHGQISVRRDKAETFADGGDSGAILLVEVAVDSYEIVGLVHTWTQGNRVAVASHIEDVITALGITLPTGV